MREYEVALNQNSLVKYLRKPAKEFTRHDIIRYIEENEIEQSGITSWPIWECDISTFDWTYADKETCYLLEGEVTVKTDEQTISFSAGDIVVFPAGLSCVWEVTKPVRKHYQFG